MGSRGWSRRSFGPKRGLVREGAEWLQAGDADAGAEVGDRTTATQAVYASLQRSKELGHRE